MARTQSVASKITNLYAHALKAMKVTLKLNVSVLAAEATTNVRQLTAVSIVNVYRLAVQTAPIVANEPNVMELHTEPSVNAHQD